MFNSGTWWLSSGQFHYLQIPTIRVQFPLKSTVFDQINWPLLFSKRTDQRLLILLFDCFEFDLLLIKRK